MSQSTLRKCQETKGRQKPHFLSEETGPIPPTSNISPPHPTPPRPQDFFQFKEFLE